MNERIRELAEQAGLKQGEWSGHPPVWMETLDSPGGLEKFAELIVRECIDIAYEYDAPKMSGPGMIIANRIQDQFGIEEVPLN